MARTLAIIRSSSPVDVEDRLVFADAALAVADHDVSDAWSRDIMERVARDEMTGDEAVAAIRRHFQG
ncbi:antitoxin VbhA family protein [Rathayibacter toxicus]|uniref:Antitoxin VbhA domain-containing protein n=1 Tax=Rathayibacter toxicus TaxID=145458 RepID=A0A0C5BDK4_9MICO|nr:antitoxin VbhA family protein [Rathayibacter toxicus]AJM77321.1 hypothetical protein TI83_03820 [Rathayibacter toxicus]ALS56806.1 hypothetical protein APU90_02650 [Rathayibacter toxicus]KKM46348.1 hypothetical protein VT73_04845 [Rathayibacter toxicus]PPG23333.1 hypothetical protein C5D15_03620 [Rathayibacter toxicus]PPG47917.1 hypothetical protein C5D16_03620 [Rathayibacter toxicus]